MTGRPPKEFEEYLTPATKSHVGHDNYVKSPGTAFLKYTIEAKCAMDLCTRHFPKTHTEYTKASIDSLQHLSVAILPSILGHFETYQRYLFAGMFDFSVYLENFNIEDFLKRIENKCKIFIDVIRLSAHRRMDAPTVGTLLSDSLTGWHNPKKVNAYFNAFNLGCRLFSNDNCLKLSVLWQLRHSIVHTGGTLTQSDAQKVQRLTNYGNTLIAFRRNFIFEVSRKLHPIVKEATELMGRKFKDRMIDDVSAEEKSLIDKFFEVKSSVPVWFR